MNRHLDVFKILLFSLLALNIAACGSFDFFKKSAGPAPTSTPAPESSLSDKPEPVIIKPEPADDPSAQIAEKNKEIQTLQSRIKYLETRVAALEKAKLSAEKINFKVDYSTPAQLYKRARNLLLENDYINAATLFKKFIKTHPSDGLADNAEYWLGECHYSLGDFETAIQVFKTIENKYPGSEKIPDAMLKTGYSYLSLDDTNRASHFLKKVIKTYPFSPAAEKAQGKLALFE